MNEYNQILYAIIFTYAIAPTPDVAALHTPRSPARTQDY